MCRCVGFPSLRAEQAGALPHRAYSADDSASVPSGRAGSDKLRWLMPQCAQVVVSPGVV